MEEDPIKNYIELYELTKSGYADEMAGIRELEEKASRYLSVMGILLGVSSLGAKFIIDNFSSFQTWFDAAVNAILFMFLLLAFITTYSLFTIFKTSKLNHIPINQELVDFFSHHSYLDSIFALTRGIVDAVATNRIVRLEKIRRLSDSYILMICSIFLLALFTSALLARPFVNSIIASH